MQARELRRLRGRGFTMIELLVSMAVLGIVSVAIVGFIVPAINAQRDVERRAALVDATEAVLRRLSRDIRVALPSSLRITNTGSGFAIELVPTIDGARYCTAAVANCATGNVLTIAAADGIFDVLGCFRHSFVTGVATNAFRLVIGNAAGAVYTATTSASVMTPVQNITPSLFPNTPAGTAVCGNASSTANSYNRHRLTLTANQTFPTASTRQRLFVVQNVDAPVSYICDTTAGTLTRYAGYRTAAGSFSNAGQPTTAATLLAMTTPPTSTGIVASNVSACSVTSTEVQVQNNSVVTLSVALSSSGDTVSLMNQVQLDNSP